MIDILCAYVITGSAEEARQISHVLVVEKIVACVNIFPAVQSVYRWKGVIEEGAEYAVLFKLPVEHFEIFQNRVKELHSYECPCIAAWPLTHGSAHFLNWIKQSTS